VYDLWTSNGSDDNVERHVLVERSNPNRPVYLRTINGTLTVTVHFEQFHTRQANPDWFNVPSYCGSYPEKSQKYNLNPKIKIATENEIAKLTKFYDSLNRTSSPQTVCDQAVACAKQICGTCHCAYVYGGEEDCCNTHSGGMDCSGMVQYSYVHCAGYSKMPRTTFEMWQQLTGHCGACSPEKTGDCHVGDLLFYYPSSSGPDHVVMYIGGGLVAECPHTGEDCHIIHPYSSPYVGCRRIC